MKMKYDIIIKNGTILDGAGKPGYRADIAVQDGKIALVGEIGEAEAVSMFQTEEE